MVKGIGLDIMLISRMEKSLETPGLSERVFTEGERAYIAARSSRAQSAAGIFAAKEAVLKALGTGIAGNPALKDIEVVHTERGGPYVRCPGHDDLKISITHMGDIAAAVAVWEPSEEV